MPDPKTTLSAADVETASVPSSDEIYEQVMADEAPAAEETDETGVTDEPTAEDEPDEPLVEAEDEPEHEESVPYERFKEANEKGKRADELATEVATLKKQQEAISQLVQQHPEVREAINRAVSGKSADTTAPASEPDGFTPFDMPKELDPDEPVNQAIIGLINETRRENFELRETLEEARKPGDQAAQKIHAQEMADLNTRFVKTLEPLEQKAGVQFTEEERDQVAAYAASLRTAEHQFGRDPSLEDMVKKAFNLVVEPHVTRAKQTRADKTGLNRPAPVGGKVGGERQFTSMEDLYDEVVGK